MNMSNFLVGVVVVTTLAAIISKSICPLVVGVITVIAIWGVVQELSR